MGRRGDTSALSVNQNLCVSIYICVCMYTFLHTDFCIFFIRLSSDFQLACLLLSGH